MVLAATGQLFHLGLCLVAFEAEVLQVVDLVASSFVQGLLVIEVRPLVQLHVASRASTPLPFQDQLLVGCAGLCAFRHQ